MRYLSDILRDLSFKEKWRRIIIGFHAPKDSGEHRYAVHTLMHMIGPSGISVAGSTAIALAALFITIGKEKEIVIWDIPSTIVDLSRNITPDPPEPEKDPPSREEESRQPQPREPSALTTWTSDSGSSDKTIDPADPLSVNSKALGSDDGIRDNDLAKISESLAPFMAKSPLIVKNLWGRTGEDRKIALDRYGHPAGSGYGKKGYASEGAVLNALRWLKKEQLPDGAWKNTKPAMTGLALLAYLAHGDTPASSQEFGTTVEKGIKWLLDNQESGGHFKGCDGHDYSHPIATYALCEAYGMTRLPSIRIAAEKAVDIIIKGQHPGGGWDYNCRQSDRDDTSYMGWCAQALKAAKMAKLENEGLSEAMKKSVMGFKKNAAPGGGFGYTSPAAGGLTGVGVLCMQLLGASREPECRNGILWLEKSATFDWEKPWLASPIYYWYYVTQTKFHCGGDIWNKWNRQFAPQLVKNQKIEKNAIMDTGGKMRDTGWWEPPAGVKGHTDGAVMDTALCTLQLEVYYRYLPTFEKVSEQPDPEPETDANELKIQVTSI